jgi:DNA ligase-1
MLAEVFNPAKHRSAGCFLSHKLDGMRVLWLPHTKGRPIRDFPFSNVDKKKDETNPIASGLWSRYGNPIMCPEWFTTGFLNQPLDGELYGGPGGFQKTMSAVKKFEPIGSEWESVRFMVFDSPNYWQIFANGTINSNNYKKRIVLNDNIAALQLPVGYDKPDRIFDFQETLSLLKKYLKETEFCKLHKQTQLPFSTKMALEIIEQQLEEVTDAGGEGLMIRHPASNWEPVRSPMLGKVKKLHDAEATVIGYRAGLGKHLGRLGSLQVRFGSTIFDLGGFTDEERAMSSAGSHWSDECPGELLPVDMVDSCPAFPLGSIITFRYRELSDDGVPKEARYHRHRPME